MTTGNNGVLYITVIAKAMAIVVDISRGIILWLKSFGPLRTTDYSPAVDSNGNISPYHISWTFSCIRPSKLFMFVSNSSLGWISIGSLDGYLYSFSPKGVLKKFPKVLNMDSVIQVSPVLDCSGYAIYVSQTQIEGKSTRIIGDYTYISGMKPEGVIFTLINPVTGTIFWSEKYPGNYPILLPRPENSMVLLTTSIDLQHCNIHYLLLHQANSPRNFWEMTYNIFFWMKVSSSVFLQLQVSFFNIGHMTCQ